MTDGLLSEVRRGALVNALGLVGKIAGPAFLIAATRLYGADAFGVFISAGALIEMAIALLTAGFKDGAMLFVARHADSDRDEHQSALYRALANALVWSFGLVLILVALAAFVAPELLPRVYPYGDRLAVVLRVMAFALPLMVFDRVVIAATQGLKIMKYEALINGGFRPLLLVTSAIAIWYVLPDERGLAVAYLITQALVAIVAVVVYARELDWAPLRRAIRHLRIDREMIRFALPQNLNTTFERFITNIDIVMLGMFNVSAATVGFYGAGALIVRELRQIKLVYSGAFAPHIVRLYHQGDNHTLARMFARTSRWISQWAIAAILCVAVLRDDLLAIISPEYVGQVSTFMLFLLVIPFLQCTLGVAANVVVMTGHSRLNLLNSVTTGVTNVVLNLVMIPPFGLVGAAAASAIAASVRATMEMTEMRMILRTPWFLRELLPPLVGGLLAAAALVIVATLTTWLVDGPVQRILVLCAAMALYVMVIRRLDR